MKIFNKLKKLFFRKNKDILKEDVDVEAGTDDLVLCEEKPETEFIYYVLTKTIKLRKQQDIWK